MQVKLSYKLFGAFFLILTIVVGAMILSRYIFSLTFRNYIHQMELEDLKRLVPVLQETYRANNGWEGISTDQQRWRLLMRVGPDARRRPPLPVPQNAAPPGSEPSRKQENRPPKDMPPGGPPQVLLMDASHRPIFGQPGPSDPRPLVPIEVDSKIVGWLGLHRYEPFNSGPPAAVLDQQARQLYLLGAVVVGLTALIAFLFSRHLLKPIQRLIRGTRELAGRNFSARIQPATRDELGQLAENFNSMADTLENYEKMRRQWITDISHELRTPLAVLRGEIEALQDGVRDPSPSNLTSLHAEILRISRLVEDLHLLSMADSESLSMNRQWISPGSVLGIIVENYRPRFDQRRIKTAIALGGIEGIRIKGDADRLGQVFTNILENACRYIRPPGVLQIIGQADKQFLTIQFQDSGPGVPEEALPRLFDRLYRVDPSRNRDAGGSGLGLSICRHIVDNHNGRIWAQNSPLGGLTIGIRLPMTNGKKG